MPFAFMGARRRAIAHMLLLGAALGVALAAIAREHPSGEPFGFYLGYWVMVVATVGATGLLARRLTASMRLTRDTMLAGFTGASAGIAGVGLDGRFALVNDAMCRILGRPRDELVGARALDIVVAEEAERVGDLSRRALAGEQVATEVRFEHPDGTPGFATLTASFVGGLPELGGFYMVQLLDLTDRRRAEEELRASERRFARLFGDARVGQVVTDLRAESDGLPDGPTARAGRMLGRDEATLAGRPWHELVHRDDRSAVVATYRRARPPFDYDARLVAARSAVLPRRRPRERRA